MKGLSIKDLKKHYSLIPLFAFLGGGMLLSAAYLARLALYNPDVSWRRKANPEPYQEYADKRYKLIEINPKDYSKFKENRPEF